jgi:hypothetical protein
MINKQVPDHSNDHFNGDRPACEESEPCPEVCSECGTELTSFRWCSKCNRYDDLYEEVLPSFEDYSNMEQGGHPNG